MPEKPRHVHVYGKHYPTLVASTSNFAFVAPAYDAYVGNRLVQEGTWMPHEIRLCRHLVPIGGTFIDAGANIGGFTIPLATHVGESGRVLAFEPFRTLFQILTANVALNGLSNVFTFQIGLSNETKDVEKRTPDLKMVANPSKMHVADTVASQMLIPYGEFEEMYIRKLDEYSLQQKRVDLIKIDVESMELPMLHGAARTLIRHRPLVFVEDSEIDSMAELRESTSVMKFLYTLQYTCINLEQSGFPDMTSILCSPAEKQDDVRRLLSTIV
jgi:FkbM family methyltransferase